MFLCALPVALDVLFARPALSSTGGFVPVAPGATAEEWVIGEAETVVAMRYAGFDAVAFSADVEKFEVAAGFMLDVGEPAWTRAYGALATADTPGEDVPLASAFSEVVVVGGTGAEPDMPVMVNMEV